MTERSSILGRIGGASAAHPWRTVAAWLLSLVAAVGLSAVIGGSTRDNYTIAGMPAQAGTDLLAQRFPDISGADARVVIHDPAGGRLDTALLATVAGRLRELPDMGAVEPPRLSADGDTAVLTIRFSIPVTDFSGREGVDLLDGAAQPARDAGLQVALGGSVPENFSPPSGTAEAVGIVAALLILIVAMGSIVGAGLPLGVALVGLGIGTSVIAIVARFADVSPTAPTIASMVGLGVGIDYALLLVARQVEGLRAGLAPPAAAAQATATAGTSVVIAGLTVLVSLLGLRLSSLNTYASFGYATAIVVLVVMAASVTLVPAVGALAGHRLLSRRTRSTVRTAAGQSKLSLLRRRDRRAPAPQGADAVDTVEGPDARVRPTQIARWAGFVGRHPVSAGLASLLVLGALAAPVVGMRTWPQDAGSQPESNTTRQAYDLVAAEFGAGANGPLLVVADLHEVSTVEQLAARLAREEGVAAVAPPLYNAARDAALIVVEPETGPQDERTSALLDRIRTQLLPDGAHVTGLVAIYADISDRLSQRLWLVIGFVVAVSLLLLTLLLRAPVVAAKAAVMNLLSVVAAYGVVTAVFQSETGARLVGLPHAVPVSSWVPILMFTVLFGLSMDYEVFLLTRVRERWLATGDATRSVVEGLAATGRVITSAAAIMVAVFTGLALDPDVTVKTTGLGMAVAVLIDATLVRMVLVPATMALLGRWNWWLPGWLDRALPRLRHGAPVRLAQLSE
jgi:RND superfamily putative drug exporter